MDRLLLKDRYDVATAARNGGLHSLSRMPRYPSVGSLTPCLYLATYPRCQAQLDCSPTHEASLDFWQASELADGRREGSRRNQRRCLGQGRATPSRSLSARRRCPTHVSARARISGRRDRRSKDTVLVWPKSRVVIALDGDNPAWWAFHCDPLYHLAAGTFTTIRYI